MSRRGRGFASTRRSVQERLGIPVVAIQANTGAGIDALKETLARAAHSSAPTQRPEFPQVFETEVAALANFADEQPDFLMRRLILDINGYIEKRFVEKQPDLLSRVREARKRLNEANCPIPNVEAHIRYGWTGKALAGCIQRPAQRPVTATDRLDRVLTHRIWGTLIFLAVMFLVFQAIFTGAKPLMDAITAAKDLLSQAVGSIVPAGPLKSLVQEGVIDGVGSIVVFVPQILILFAFIAILEDCGYMARAAFLMDRLMSRCGLSGKSFIPMLSSVACAVPGIMATRVIENRRDRLATILVAPLMSCSARLPVYVLLIGAFIKPGRPWWVSGLTMFAMYLIGIVVAPLVAWALKRTLLRGDTPIFVMEMPVYKWPSLRTVTRRVFDAGWSFVRRAGTFILASMIIVWALLYFPRTGGNGDRYDLAVNALDRRSDELKEKIKTAGDAEKEKLERELDTVDEQHNELYGLWKRQSYLGQAGRAMEPAVKPLGWDWRLGMAALASFPAREVVVGTLGIIYNQGAEAKDELESARDPGETKLGRALKDATWDGDPTQKVFTVPTALSLMVFFALCCQCASTLAVIRRETNSWRWPAFTFAYMTILAYFGALLTYQVGTMIAG